jgi:hypothetical protein
MLKYIVSIIIFISACQPSTENIRLNLNERQAQQLSHFLKSYQIDAIPFQDKKEWGLQVSQSQLKLTWQFLQKNGLTQLKTKAITATPKNTQWWMNQRDKSTMERQKLLDEIEHLLLMLPKLNAFYVDLIDHDNLLIYLKTLNTKNPATNLASTDQVHLIKQTLLKILPKTQIEVMIDEISFNEYDQSSDSNHQVQPSAITDQQDASVQVGFMHWLTLGLSFIALIVSIVGIVQWYRQKKLLIS